MVINACRNEYADSTKTDHSHSSEREMLVISSSMFDAAKLKAQQKEEQ
jgi:hypothetical protein